MSASKGSEGRAREEEEKEPGEPKAHLPFPAKRMFDVSWQEASPREPWPRRTLLDNFKECAALSPKFCQLNLKWQLCQNKFALGRFNSNFKNADLKTCVTQKQSMYPLVS